MWALWVWKPCNPLKSHKTAKALAIIWLTKPWIASSKVFGTNAMNLTDPRFTDPDKAREYLEAQRWPNGPDCPHCGNADGAKISALNGNAHRDGLYQCGECREQFTVTVGSLMERSKIPLNKWLLAMHLMGSSKKGGAAHQ